MSGKTAIVTGGNAGLGRICVDWLAAKGASVHMLCRNAERGEKARDEVIEASGNEEVHLHIVDCSVGRQVLDFAKDFAAGGHALDVLILNAGVMVEERKLTDEGFETTYATNLLCGSYLLLDRLIRSLQKASGSRVIVVSSGGMLTKKLDVSKLTGMKGSFDGTDAYAFTKRGQVYLTERYAAKFPGIKFVSMHPGWSDTPGVSRSMPGFKDKMGDNLRTPEQGADTVLWLSAVDSERLENGEFYFDRKPADKHLNWNSTSVPETDVEKMMQLLAKDAASLDAKGDENESGAASSEGESSA